MTTGAEGPGKTASIAVQNQRLAALYAVSALGRNASSRQAQGFRAARCEKLVVTMVAVRWSDEANERYVLLAGDGPPGPWRRGALPVHRLCHCGQPQEQARTRVIPITPSTHGGAAPLPRSRV